MPLLSAKIQPCRQGCGVSTAGQHTNSKLSRGGIYASNGVSQQHFKSPEECEACKTADLQPSAHASRLTLLSSSSSALLENFGPKDKHIRRHRHDAVLLQPGQARPWRWASGSSFLRRQHSQPPTRLPARHHIVHTSLHVRTASTAHQADGEGPSSASAASLAVIAQCGWRHHHASDLVHVGLQ